jgi:hypothetical protein
MIGLSRRSRTNGGAFVNDVTDFGCEGKNEAVSGDKSSGTWKSGIDNVVGDSGKSMSSALGSSFVPYIDVS